MMDSALSQINRAWRLLMTGLCFSFFGLGGLLLSLTWFNLLLLIQPDPARRRKTVRASISWSFRIFLAVTRFVGVFDYRFTGTDLLKQDKGCLIVANHPTLVDYVLLASVLPDCDCLVKEGLLKNPFMRGVVKAADYLVNSEAETMVEACRQRLDEGGVILIFPEGTRSVPGQPVKLQRGAAHIAVRCRRDIRIVRIQCSQFFLYKNIKWYKIPSEKPLFTVDVKDKVQVENFSASPETSAAIFARRLTGYLTEALA